ncbi:hypothetical protein J120_00865 [candidate division TM6 bacterium JCVI TM6SC1]|uniref:Uncharacterized protein n=1 Tax=candidate division TM6 bacterium JCVI TM6SC1 TaxID=1306947 RepID=A0A0D2I2T0_9BACT|nr:hypothetical protein J120_00865 [candidate division TM6 bacterium JCVI TM6SC1]
MKINTLKRVISLTIGLATLSTSLHLYANNVTVISVEQQNYVDKLIVDLSNFMERPHQVLNSMLTDPKDMRPINAYAKELETILLDFKNQVINPLNLEHSQAHAQSSTSPYTQSLSIAQNILHEITTHLQKLINILKNPTYTKNLVKLLTELSNYKVAVSNKYTTIMNQLGALSNNLAVLQLTAALEKINSIRTSLEQAKEEDERLSRTPDAATKSNLVAVLTPKIALGTRR